MADDGAAAIVPCAANDATAPLPPALRVLTLGDGNFSFSLAYLRKHQGAVQLVATSYDSYDELIAKYPESIRICAQLRELGATLLHRVDATNLQVSLTNAAGASPLDMRFDRIIFNHPHCGEENVQRHQSFLSHFYASARQLIGSGDARVLLTLADGQAERWLARERARSAGLVIVEEVDDVDAHAEYAVEYERKRHQNGKSFHRVLLHGERKEQRSTLFVFGVQQCQPKADANLETASRKRKLNGDATSARQPELRQPDASGLACEACARSFKTAQGLKTHLHMVHKLGVAGSSQQAVACEHCDRTFKNDEALRQHNISKHGDDSTIQPDWYTRTRPAQTAIENPAAPVDKEQTCAVCEFSFDNESAFRAHWEELRPKLVVRKDCSLCGRGFEEERALRQHVNFCRAKPASADR